MERSVGDGTLFWWSPAQRCVIPLDGLRVTRSMRRSARRYHLRLVETVTLRHGPVTLTVA
ncbi:MAG: hypothetical protein EBR63_02755 [Actinobacteria bacterium]|nr:hypothetical protein [Actinomycetota bacterium]